MAGLILLSLAALVPQALAACSSIEVRKEWRNFTVPEKTAWIDAVKVRINMYYPRIIMLMSESVYGQSSSQRLFTFDRWGICSYLREYHDQQLVL